MENSNKIYKALQGDWQTVFDEVKQMKEACGAAHMKAILAVGELGTMENVYKASMVCMQAGSDFIKTSTGKEGVNAILPGKLIKILAKNLIRYNQSDWLCAEQSENSTLALALKLVLNRQEESELLKIH